VGLFDAAQGAAAATPYGAAASALGQAAASPVTSRSGDITSGAKGFDFGRVGGLQLGGGVPPWLLAVGIVAVVFVLVYRR
jgi:hypothetical protein